MRPTPAAERRATRGKFGASHLRTLVRLLSYGSATVALLPAMLHEAHEANYAPLANRFRRRCAACPSR
jgi:hypothetical protein